MAKGEKRLTFLLSSDPNDPQQRTAWQDILKGAIVAFVLLVDNSCLNGLKAHLTEYK